MDTTYREIVDFINKNQTSPMEMQEAFIWAMIDFPKLTKLVSDSQKQDPQFSWYNLNEPTRKDMLDKFRKSLASYEDEEFDVFTCPFCNSHDLYFAQMQSYMDDVSKEGYAVVCESCGAMSGTYDSEHEAIWAWNRRAEDEKT